MFALLHHSLLFAQEQVAGEDDGAMPRLLMMVMGFGFLMYFLLIRPQKRKDQDFRRMVSELKENNHVVTVGGIHGVVTNVQRDADRITIRVDESTGTKLRVSTSSIARVITDEGESSKATDGLSK